MEQARTNTFALPILRRADRVIVLTVEGGTTPGPTGEQAAVQLARNGIKASALTVKPEGRATGEVILHQAALLGCDLLVKGAYTRSNPSHSGQCDAPRVHGPLRCIHQRNLHNLGIPAF